MTARSLLIGLDGADLTLIRALGRACTPTLHGLMDLGMFAACRSVTPPATLPNWTTLLTGVDPGVHGVFDFTTRNGYQVRFTAGSVREAPTIVSALDRQGLTCACIGFPATWPPERLQHGVFISGWDAPVAFESDASFVWPTALHRQITERFGPQRFDDVDELNADAPGWHAQLPNALCARIERKVELAQWLLRDRPWDLFAFYFGESDTAAHHLWALHDARSPRHPHDTPADPGLARVYQQLDAAVSTLIDTAGGDGVEVTIVSDHGSGGASDKVLYLNRVLGDLGALRFRSRMSSQPLTAWMKKTALTRLPPKLRETLFRAGGARLPSWLESRARFSAIDMPHTLAFSDELNYFPAIHWNLRGREPEGALAPDDLPRIERALIDGLLALRDPWSGRAVIAAVHRREELFTGPFVARAPDLILDLHLDDGYSYNVMPSVTDTIAPNAFRRLHASEHLGRKGRSLAGSHRPCGLFIASGPQVAPVGEVDVHIADVTATLLARVNGVPTPLQTPRRAEMITTPPPMRTHAAHVGHDEAKVASRLRALGYIE